MFLELNKRCGWKKVYLNVLNKNYELIHKKELKFKDSLVNVEFNLENDCFFYSSNDKGYQTETIIISKPMGNGCFIYFQ